MADDLSREMEVYSRLLPSMAGDEGKFVVIFGETVVGKFESYSDALTAGYTAAGLKPFLVKRISSMPAVSRWPNVFCVEIANTSSLKKMIGGRVTDGKLDMALLTISLPMKSS